MRTVNRQNGIRATPAGSEMKVRMIGSMRVKKTVASPWRSNQRSAQSRCWRLMWMQPVLLEQLDAAVVADRVGDPGADEVAEHAGGDDPEQGQCRPSETLKPANSMVASLGIGMQALSSVISTKTPATPDGVDEVGGGVDDRVE